LHEAKKDLFVENTYSKLVKTNLSPFLCRSVPESPRWLMIVGRVSEAEDILSETALYNGLALPKTLLQIGRPMQLSRSYHGCLELCRNCYIAKKTIIITSIW
jgi:hypothetical protein